MAEAGVREFNQRVIEKYHTDDIYGLLDWWAGFSQSEAIYVQKKLAPINYPGDTKAFSVVGLAFQQSVEGTRKEGMKMDKPYGWGNKSSIEQWSSTAAGMYEANRNKYPIIFAYRTGVDPFYIPSGCAVTNWVNSKPEYAVHTDPNVCDYILQKD